MTLRTDYSDATLLDDVHAAAHNETNTTANSFDARLAALEAIDRKLDAIEVRSRGLELSVGVPTLDRANIAGLNGLTNNRPYLAYLTAPAAMTCTRIRTYCGTVAAVTPTTIELGVYREETNGDLTLLQKTANLAGVVYTTPDTAYEPALVAPVALMAGQRYTLAVVVVASTIPNTMFGVSVAPVGTELMQPPRRSAFRSPNVGNLVPSIPVANLNALGAAVCYLVALP